MEPERYILTEGDEKISHPRLTFCASDEYQTEIVVELPSGQQLNISIDPDYVDQPTVTINLTD